MIYSKALGSSLALLCVSFDAYGWCLTKTIRELWATPSLSESTSYAGMTFVCTNAHSQFVTLAHLLSGALFRIGTLISVRFAALLPSGELLAKGIRLCISYLTPRQISVFPWVFRIWALAGRLAASSRFWGDRLPLLYSPGPVKHPGPPNHTYTLQLYSLQNFVCELQSGPWSMSWL